MREVWVQVHAPTPARFLITPGVHTVGRDPDNALCLDHPSVSAHHGAIIRQPDDQILVRDLGSTNGTFLDGLQVVASPFAPGQELRLGEIRLTLDAPSLPASPRLATVLDPVPSEAVGSLPGPPPAGSSLWRRIPGALAYGFQGDAWFVILGVAALQVVPIFLPGPTGIFALILGALIVAYLYGLFREILHATIQGDDRLPPAPDMSYNWDDLRDALAKVFVPTFVAFAPAGAAQWVPGLPPWSSVLLAAGGCFFLPMALLGVMISESLGAVSPVFVFRSIARSGQEYLVLVLGIAAVLILQWLPDELVRHLTLGWFLRVALSVFTSVAALYLLIVWARLLGLFYCRHRDRLSWTVGEDDDTPL